MEFNVGFCCILVFLVVCVSLKEVCNVFLGIIVNYFVFVCFRVIIFSIVVDIWVEVMQEGISVVVVCGYGLFCNVIVYIVQAVIVGEVSICVYCVLIIVFRVVIMAWFEVGQQIVFGIMCVV